MGSNRIVRAKDFVSFFIEYDNLFLCGFACIANYIEGDKVWENNTAVRPGKKTHDRNVPIPSCVEREYVRNRKNPVSDSRSRAGKLVWAARFDCFRYLVFKLVRKCTKAN